MRAWEQHTLNLFSEYRVNNEKNFNKKTEALKAKEMIQAKSSQLEAMIAKACRTMPELNILEEAPLEAKIQKLAAGICDSKVEVASVQFELNMKIIEVDLNS